MQESVLTLPDFSLLNQDGREVKSSDFSGRYLCIYFYPKDSTPGCTTQGCVFRDHNAQLADLNCAVVGVSKDNVRSHKKFHSQQGFNFDLLADTDHKLAEALGNWKQKSMMGVKYMGMDRATFLFAPDGKLIQTWPEANPDTNALEIINFLNSQAL